MGNELNQNIAAIRHIPIYIYLGRIIIVHSNRNEYRDTLLIYHRDMCIRL